MRKTWSIEKKKKKRENHTINLKKKEEEKKQGKAGNVTRTPSLGIVRHRLS